METIPFLEPNLLRFLKSECLDEILTKFLDDYYRKLSWKEFLVQAGLSFRFGEAEG